MKLRERLDQLILFGEAARAIEKQNKVDESERIVTKLPLGVERALLQLGLASFFVTKKELARAEEFINASLRDARRLDDNRVAFIMLTAAGELARINSPDALPVLAESVRKLNADKADATEVVWEEKITCGPLWRNWPLEIKGLNNSFSRALPHLMKADADVTVETILKLTSERYLSEALLKAAEIVLNEQTVVQIK